MIKKLIPTVILAALAAYLFFNSYTQRSVASFLWGASFGLVVIAILFSFLRNTVVVLISLVITLAIAESALGYLPAIMAKKPDSGINTAKDKTVFAYFDSAQTYNTPAYWHLGEFGSQPKPGIFTAKKVASNGDVLYDTFFTIGPDGFRVTPRYGDKQSHRINFLGDSFTFGEGVADNQTMAYYVGDLMNSQHLGASKWAPLQVKNYGIHGWGIHQSLAVLQSDLDTKANLNFVLTAPWHASRVACADFFTLGSPKYRLEESGLVKRDGYCRSFGWVEHSPKALRGLITSSKVFNLIQDSLLVINDQDKQIQLYLGALRTIQQEAKQRGEQLVVGFIKADDAWFVGSYNNDKILAELKKSGIQMIDMTLADKNENLKPKFYVHELDKHPSSLGNLERSKLLVQKLDK
ncbi:hypothetical protein [Polynucleobacter sp. AP-Kaivos-20-H2]|uniref:hypothetical protein n=1 Tax=Polynucleobacter sp. AP-Kaivos-20-H2 TaxID=2689104 RepID=UPI001C0BD28B|nr:hypothetical protein [Polynucleobacter sp. AP-Kaivos-20-H2]MBU3604084.1 AzlD domain-containing protein [Polynucleobacter sp. AP-Kaivos-20-H2]